MMYFDGEYCFSLSDSNEIDENIDAIIGFEPTQVIKKGESITSKRVAPYNIWMYLLEFDSTNFDYVTEIFAQRLSRFKDNIKSIIPRYERVEIDIYVRSEYGQFGFTICNNELAELSTMGLNINFHILSFGLVRDVRFPKKRTKKQCKKFNVPFPKIRTKSNARG